eukprot:scaffold3609_cov65-Cyclotella_meneghiniana.AAC.11
MSKYPPLHSRFLAAARCRSRRSFIFMPLKAANVVRSGSRESKLRDEDVETSYQVVRIVILTS